MSIKGFSVNGAVEQYDYNALANKPATTGLSDEAKQALLTCFENVAWINEDGQTYVDALEAALYPPANLVSISAVYTQSGTVYDTDTLDSLKADLVVTATYDNGTTATVTAYTLSGTLTEGTSTITVSYGGKTDTFDVTVTESPLLPAGYTQYDYVYNNTPTAGDANQMVNTGLSGDYCGGGYTHELTFSVENAAQSTSYAMYGLRATTGSDPRARAYWSKLDGGKSMLACNYYGIDSGFIFEMTTGVKYKSVTGNRQWTINDVLIMDNMYSDTYNPYTEGYIRLYGIQTGTNAHGGYTRHIMRIYGFNVIDESTGAYVARMIPCVNNSTNTAGFYDVIRDAFYAADTPSRLTAGND